VAKGKKAMFVFILEVLDGDGPKSGSFWEVLKKHRHHPTLPKKPEVPPAASEALVEAPLTPTPLEQPDPDGHDLMTGVVHPALPDPPTPPPSNLSHPLAEAVFAILPIPHEFDHTGIVRWDEYMHAQQFSFNEATLDCLAALSGHTGIHATHVTEALCPFFL